MRFYEFEAKQVLADHGVPVPKSFGVVRSVAEIEELINNEVHYPVMVKAQALVGGRGKAGGVARAGDARKLKREAKRILALQIGDYPVEAVLVEEALVYKGACYLGFTGNPVTANTVVMASAEGGVDIEEVARTRPEAILKVELADNPVTLPAETAREVAEFLVRGLGAAVSAVDGLARVVTRLYAAYQAHDAKVLEVNPLLVTEAGPVAADGKLVIDDNALYRQGRLLRRLGITAKRHDVAEPSANERRAAEAGFFYVDLLPEGAARQPGKVYVGLVPGGAGYGIFSIDEVTNVGERFFGGNVVPVNFMDSGGGPTVDSVAAMFDLLMDYPLVDFIITSRFGGISSCDVFIRGLVGCLRRRRAQGQRVLPVYGRMVGTDLPSARAFLEVAVRETPDDLRTMRMVVGNRLIMVDVIRDALDDFFSDQATDEVAGKTVGV